MVCGKNTKFAVEEPFAKVPNGLREKQDKTAFSRQFHLELIIWRVVSDHRMKKIVGLLETYAHRGCYAAGVPSFLSLSPRFTFTVCVMF
jgi:hypothetical protein